MALEAEARLLRAGIRANLLDPDKGTAALVLFAKLQNMGASFTFGEFLVERGLLSEMALEGLEQNLHAGKRAIQTTSQLDDYELLELLAEGQTGSVFRARDLTNERTLAVKILKPSLARDNAVLKRFLNEAYIATKLNHPHIVKIYRVGNSQGLYYIGMELVEGGTLQDLLSALEGQGLRLERAVRLLMQIASALHAAHAAGLTHRDVKPGNVLLTKESAAKVGDFGLAQFHEAQSRTGNTTPHGEFWGTAEYMAPEVIQAGAVSDPRSDLYSLGALFFEMLAGRLPFIGETPQKILLQHLHVQPPSLLEFCPTAPTPLVELVAKLLAKRPEERFQSAFEVIQHVRNAFTRQPQAQETKATPKPLPPPPPSAPPRAPSGAQAGRDAQGRRLRTSTRASRPPSGAQGSPRRRPSGDAKRPSRKSPRTKRNRP